MPVNEAKAHFSEILRRVERGETIAVTRHSRIVAEIKPFENGNPAPRLGSFDGEFPIPDDAFAPLNEEELREWYGE